MELDAQEIKELIKDDEVFKQYVILKLKEMDNRLSNIENTFKWIKRLLGGILGYILAKLGINLSGINF